MSVKEIKDLLKQINEPNSFELTEYDLTNPTYWIYKGQGIRIKQLNQKFVSLRSNAARYDIFVNELFVPKDNYVFEQISNGFYIKFIKANFDYIVHNYDTVSITGDIETF